jgi:hypothetical protein
VTSGQSEHLKSARTRWQVFRQGSLINRFLREVKDATVQAVPPEKET